MIDLILQGTKANIIALAKARNIVDANGVPAPGSDYCWWAGDGKFLTAKAVMSGQTVVTPATYLAGFVALIRIGDPGDALPGSGEQWLRSKVAAYVKDNGTPGTVGGISYYEVALVRLFRAADVLTWLAAQGLPGHEWAGGSTL